ncbi:MAG: radical SAM protein [bacterium]|nr:radical SAM protein [bacterium]
MQTGLAHKYLFGPVASRRLGRSLGVDLLPFKTCTLDCVYCECGRTTTLTTERAAFVPVNDVLAELAEWLKSGGTADFITLAGSGEPTLHTGLAEVLRGIRALTNIPTCLLTNGTLFHLPEVRAAAALADVVVPSLDAPDPLTFARINRPAPGVDFDAYLQGLRTFAAEYRGALWLEIFIVPGINDSPECIRALAAQAAELHPAKIQLNTAVRPPAESFVRPATPAQLAAIAPQFTPPAEVIASFRATLHEQTSVALDEVLQLVRRRPCTVHDVAHGLSISFSAARAALTELSSRGAVIREVHAGLEFYRAPGA